MRGNIISVVSNLLVNS